MCMILLQRHIGGVARMGPESGWLLDMLPETDADRPDDCADALTDKEPTVQAAAHRQ